MFQFFSKKMNKKRKGFTLIELVVVIAILGILAAIAIPRFLGQRESANEGAVIANLRTIQSGAELTAANNNLELDDAALDQAAITAIIGNWPVGPAGVTYTWTGGVATAVGTDTIPYPADGVTSYTDLTTGGI